MAWHEPHQSAVTEEPIYAPLKYEYHENNINITLDHADKMLARDRAMVRAAVLLFEGISVTL